MSSKFKTSLIKKRPSIVRRRWASIICCSVHPLRTAGDKERKVNCNNGGEPILQKKKDTFAMKTTVKHVKNKFLNSWIFQSSSPSHLMLEKGSQFVRKFLTTFCGLVGLKHLTPTANHTQTNVQVKRYDRMTVTRWRHYVAEHQDDLNIYLSRCWRTRTTTMFIDPLVCPYLVCYYAEVCLRRHCLILLRQFPRI